MHALLPLRQSHGKKGFFVDAGNIHLMVRTMLNALAQADYRRISFFDASQGLSSFQRLANCLLIHIITGIQLRVLLIQTAIDAFDNILNRILDKRREYALSTACYILNLNPSTFELLDGCSADRREIWFDNLMPEVRGRLIYVLIVDKKGIYGRETDNSYRDEALQREAILSFWNGIQMWGMQSIDNIKRH